jgi:hypothetical protein
MGPSRVACGLLAVLLLGGCARLGALLGPQAEPVRLEAGELHFLAEGRAELRLSLRYPPPGREVTSGALRWEAWLAGRLFGAGQLALEPSAFVAGQPLQVVIPMVHRAQVREVPAQWATLQVRGLLRIDAAAEQTRLPFSGAAQYRATALPHWEAEQD